MQARFEHFADCLAGLADVPGDFIELGVYKGATFVPLAKHALALGRRCLGVDSFVGFSAAHPIHDRMPDGSFPYDIGGFDAGGEDTIRELKRRLDYSDSVEFHAGFIPDVLERIAARPFAFAHVDLDQYVPTLESLIWLWARMSPGGLIACHDWFPEYNCLASLAIRNFCQDKGLAAPPESPVRYAFLRKKSYR